MGSSPSATLTPHLTGLMLPSHPTTSLATPSPTCSGSSPESASSSEETSQEMPNGKSLSISSCTETQSPRRSSRTPLKTMPPKMVREKPKTTPSVTTLRNSTPKTVRKMVKKEKRKRPGAETTPPQEKMPRTSPEHSRQSNEST